MKVNKPGEQPSSEAKVATINSFYSIASTIGLARSSSTCWSLTTKRVAQQLHEGERKKGVDENVPESEDISLTSRKALLLHISYFLSICTCAISENVVTFRFRNGQEILQVCISTIMKLQTPKPRMETQWCCLSSSPKILTDVNVSQSTWELRKVAENVRCCHLVLLSHSLPTKIGSWATFCTKLYCFCYSKVWNICLQTGNNSSLDYLRSAIPKARHHFET